MQCRCVTGVLVRPALVTAAARHAYGLCGVTNSVSSTDELLSLLLSGLRCRHRPAYWPNATVALPGSLSLPGNIYRAQLLLVAKADACEEFWAMNPSGALTNSNCTGISTGEPYREVSDAATPGGLAPAAPSPLQLNMHSCV